MVPERPGLSDHADLGVNSGSTVCLQGVRHWLNCCSALQLPSLFAGIYSLLCKGFGWHLCKAWARSLVQSVISAWTPRRCPGPCLTSCFLFLCPWGSYLTPVTDFWAYFLSNCQPHLPCLPPSSLLHPSILGPWSQQPVLPDLDSCWMGVQAWFSSGLCTMATEGSEPLWSVQVGRQSNRQQCTDLTTKVCSMDQQHWHHRGASRNAESSATESEFAS